MFKKIHKVCQIGNAFKFFGKNLRHYFTPKNPTGYAGLETFNFLGKNLWCLKNPQGLPDWKCIQNFWKNLRHYFTPKNTNRVCQIGNAFKIWEKNLCCHFIPKIPTGYAGLETDSIFLGENICHYLTPKKPKGFARLERYS